MAFGVEVAKKVLPELGYLIVTLSTPRHEQGERSFSSVDTPSQQIRQSRASGPAQPEAMRCQHHAVSVNVLNNSVFVDLFAEHVVTVGPAETMAMPPPQDPYFMGKVSRWENSSTLLPYTRILYSDRLIA